jgi:hypothetical protein
VQECSAPMYSRPNPAVGRGVANESGALHAVQFRPHQRASQVVSSIDRHNTAVLPLCHHAIHKRSRDVGWFAAVLSELPRATATKRASSTGAATATNSARCGGVSGRRVSKPPRAAENRWSLVLWPCRLFFVGCPLRGRWPAGEDHPASSTALIEGSRALHPAPSPAGGGRLLLIVRLSATPHCPFFKDTGADEVPHTGHSPTTSPLGSLARLRPSPQAGLRDSSCARCPISQAEPHRLRYLVCRAKLENGTTTTTTPTTTTTTPAGGPRAGQLVLFKSIYVSIRRGQRQLQAAGRTQGSKKGAGVSNHIWHCSE